MAFAGSVCRSCALARGGAALEVVKPNWLIASPAFLCVALSTQPLISLQDEEEAAPSKDLFDLHANG
jgi:hypothetical protein